jgi:uncharacterized protein (UPF0333 family)
MRNKGQTTVEYMLIIAVIIVVISVIGGKLKNSLMPAVSRTVDSAQHQAGYLSTEECATIAVRMWKDK